MMLFPKTPDRKKKKVHAASILQKEGDRTCILCALEDRALTQGVHQHHVFGGTANRDKSEQYGLKVWLCYEHHEGSAGVHRNREADLRMKRYAQTIFEKKYSHELFMQEFGRNYL